MGHILTNFQGFDNCDQICNLRNSVRSHFKTIYYITMCMTAWWLTILGSLLQF